jgi:membrane fusion protein, multidrug efflux system
VSIKRRITTLAVGLAVAIAVTAAVGRIWFSPDTSPAAGPPRLSTATVRQTTLVDSRLISGTLGYRALPPLVNQLPGIYTWLPKAGATIRMGHVLYRVDNMPVLLLRGSTPAWRALAPSVPPGPDVRQLNRDLVHMGYGAGLAGLSGDDYGVATQIAVERWQEALGVPVTGTVAFGEVAFRPGPVRAGSLQASVGEGAPPGGQPYQVTSPSRVVVASISANDASEAVLGAPVRLQVPGGTAFRGRIRAITPTVAPAAGGGGPAVTITIAPANPPRTPGVEQEPVEVALATAIAHHVLAVPITALVALRGGGYGVELVTANGSHRVIRVHTGLFASGLVEVRGVEIGSGTRVVVSQ